MNTMKRVVTRLLDKHVDRTCRLEYESQTFERFNERPVEFAFVFQKIGELYPRRVLDVGTGTTALPHLMRNCGCVVTAIDNVRDYWPTGMTNRHWHIIDDDIVRTRLGGEFDLVTCISTLEHIREADRAVTNMSELLRPGGHLLLTFPFSAQQYIENVYTLPGSSYGQDAPYITQSFSRADVSRWVASNHLRLADQQFWQYWDGPHWTVGSQVIPPKRVAETEKHSLSCLLFEKV